MVGDNIYIWVRDSLYAFCGKFKTDMSVAYPSNPVLSLYNFDAFSQQNTLPSGDFVGIRSLTVDMNKELATVSCMVGLSTNNDENLFRLEDLSGQLFNRLLPEVRIPIYQSGQDPAVFKGWMVLMNGTSIGPVVQALQRPLKFVAMRGAIGLPLQPLQP